MFAGHAALAMLAKSARRRVSVVLLVIVAFAPDILQRMFDAVHRYNRELSHSLLSIAIGSTAVALVYWAVTRNGTDAVAVWLAYLSHWPADVITGIKPTWPNGPMVGLFMYRHPGRDLIVETDVILLCWMAYWYSLTTPQRSRAINLLVPWALIALQIAFDYGLMLGVTAF